MRISLTELLTIDAVSIVGGQVIFKHKLCGHQDNTEVELMDDSELAAVFKDANDMEATIKELFGVEEFSTEPSLGVERLVASLEMEDKELVEKPRRGRKAKAKDVEE